jgi:hypothetical protein
MSRLKLAAIVVAAFCAIWVAVSITVAVAVGPLADDVQALERAVAGNSEAPSCGLACPRDPPF